MSHAEGLVAPPDVQNASGLNERATQKKRGLRGRCALFLLLAMTVAGYGIMIYFGQVLFVK